MTSDFSLNSFRLLGRRYAQLFTAGILSDIGGFTTHTALVLHVYSLTNGNVTYMGLTALAGLVPMLLAAPLGGVLAERHSRKWVMFSIDIIRIPLVLLMLTTTSSVWTLLALQSLISAATAAFNPSRQAIIPDLVGRDRIHLANTINGGAMSVVHVLGPVFGAVVYAKTGTLFWIVILNAATYAISAAIISMMNYRRDEGAKLGGNDFFRDVYEGFRYVRNEKDLLYLLFILCTSGASVGLLVPLLRPFTDQVLHRGAETYGYLIGAFGAGGMAGPILGYFVGRRLGIGRTIATALAIEAALLIVWSRITDWRLSCLTLFVWGVVIFTMIPCYLSYLHTYSKKEFIGRTFALFDQAHFGPQILGAAIVAMFGGAIPTQKILTIAGVVYLVVVALTWPSSHAKLLRSRRGEEHKDDEPKTGGQDGQGKTDKAVA